MNRPETSPPRPSQARFAQALLDPSAPLPEGLARSGGQPPVKRFAVYRNNVVASLTEALGKAYPEVKRLVGDAFFTGMAGHFVRAHPPRSPVMLEYGAGFAEWLETFEPVRDLSYLPDVARLERARLDAYHAADAEPLTADRAQAAFAGLTPEAVAGARLTPHPALRLLDLAHPALSIWKLSQSGEGGKIASGGERVIVARPVEDITLRAAPPGGFAFVSALAAGETIAVAADAAEQAEPGFDVARALGAAFAAGFFSGVVTPQD